jgi:hypothetical protein
MAHSLGSTAFPLAHKFSSLLHFHWLFCLFGCSISYTLPLLFCIHTFQWMSPILDQPANLTIPYLQPASGPQPFRT